MAGEKRDFLFVACDSSPNSEPLSTVSLRIEFIDRSRAIPFARDELPAKVGFYIVLFLN